MGVYKRHMRKNTLTQRLNIIKGQVNGLINLIEQKENCHQVTAQFYAINIALKKTIELYFKENLASCLKSVKPKERKTIDFLLKEIIKNK